MDQLAEIIARQQSFMESVDRRERETRLVVLCVREEGESLGGATSEENKLQKIFCQMDEAPNVESITRLDRDGIAGRKRSMLIKLSSRAAMDKALTKTGRLKDVGGSYRRICVKKYMHPSLRKDWKRLREVESIEKARSKNYGCVVRLDERYRKRFTKIM